MKKNFATLVASVALALTTTSLLAATPAGKTLHQPASAKSITYSLVALPQECTATATVTVAGQSISLSATAGTCAEALKMLRDTIKDL